MQSQFNAALILIENLVFVVVLLKVRVEVLRESIGSGWGYSRWVVRRVHKEGVLLRIGRGRRFMGLLG